MWLSIAEHYRKILEQNGLRKFSDFMTYDKGEVIKQIHCRTIMHSDLSSKDGIQSVFLKRHSERNNAGEVIRNLLSGFSISWGRKEWEVIKAFEESGIPTLTPIAAGEDISWFRQKSFLMTKGLEEYESLNLFINKHFIPPLTRDKIIKKRGIIKELAQLTKDMHDKGFNHRDFYLNHIFIRDDEGKPIQWSILDLQRVDRRRWFRLRWIIKDLAALNYSALSPFITTTDRIRFLKYYMPQSTASIYKRIFVWMICLKTHRIKRHDNKLKSQKYYGRQQKYYSCLF